MVETVHDDIGTVIRDEMRNFTKGNPGLLVSRELCEERSGNIQAQLNEIKWVQRAVAVALLIEVLTGVL